MIVAYTIGCGSADMEQFTRILEMTGVELLVDVRECRLPGQQKRSLQGFSKIALGRQLSTLGIRYQRMEMLAPPAREDMRNRDGSLSRTRYRDWLRHTPGKEAVAELVGLTRDYTICLMGLSRDPGQCHRRVLVDMLEKKGAIAIDLQADAVEHYERVQLAMERVVVEELAAVAA